MRIRVLNNLNKIVVTNNNRSSMCIFDIVDWTGKVMFIEKVCQYYEFPSQNVYDNKAEVQDTDLPYFAELDSDDLDIECYYQEVVHHVNQTYQCNVMIAQ